jgi:diguanylate cyclase (GGDEF)-like protein
MLAEFGKLIGKHIRSSDMAARYGGDEFAIILPHTGKEQAVIMAENLLDMMKKTRFTSDNDEIIPLTASFGVATYPSDADNKEDLIRTSDIAMYAAKEAGRAGVRGF